MCFILVFTTFLFQIQLLLKYRKKSYSNQPFNKLLWLKYRIEIHFQPIRTIPIYFDICIQANANHFEPIRKTFCILFDEKQSKINPNESERIRARIDPSRIFNQNQSKSFRPSLYSFWMNQSSD